METSTRFNLRRKTTLRAMLLLALATAFSGLSTPSARADDRHHDDDHRRPEHHRAYAYEHPRGYYTAPPPVYQYQPPPPPPAVDFVFPLHLR